MSSAQNCRECGTAIPADSPGGFCAQCLFALALKEVRNAESGVQNEKEAGSLATSDAPAQAADPKSISGSTAPVMEKPGDRIGRYRLIEEIGHGGCGVVYMAEQEEPVRRRVALKVIKLGMDTRQVVARFEAERQALALMDHPNIARVIDAGSTNTGRPYFVMELVGGIKITDYCEKNQLPASQRLDLFIQVCRAIQHAHQKGVIHRDIKPSNVLVATQDGVPVPKVIDFGIAKATQGKLSDQTVFTAFEQFLGTPAYMSPEQAQVGGLDVDTRSDIYSLGVLLYELLTGKTPFDAKELLAAGLEAMRRTIQEKEPPTPSTRLKEDLEASGRDAFHRVPSIRVKDGDVVERVPTGNQLKELIHLVRGDLDWIVMKCLEKDRGRRYETANGLAMDIQRHLNNEPVVAGPTGIAYRLGKLVRRNKTAVAVAVGITAVLVLGIAASIWEAQQQSRLRQQAQAAQANEARERQKAQNAAAKSEQVAKFLRDMLEGVGPSKALGRDTTMLKEILDKTAERVGKELTNQPEVQLELREILASTYQELALYGPAQEMARESLRLARARFGEESPAGAEALREIGVAQRHLGNYGQAEMMHRRALDIRRKLFGDEDVNVAMSLQELAHVLQDQGKFAEAETHYREALATYRKRLGNEDLLTAGSLSDLAAVLDARGKPVESEGAYREALKIQRKLSGDEHPRVATSLHNLAHALVGQEKLAEAEATQREALTMRRKLLGNDHPDVAGSLNNLAGILQRERKFAEAEAMYRETLALRRALLGDEHPSTATTLNNLANCLSAENKQEEAEALNREALAIRRKRLGNDHPDVAGSLNNLANVMYSQGKLEQAEAMHREALAIARKSFGDQHPNVAMALGNVADDLSGLGRLAEAEAAYREALEIKRKQPGYGYRMDAAITLDGLCSVLEKQYRLGETKKLSEAEALARERLDIAERVVPDEWWTFNSRSLLGGNLLEQKRYAEAEPLLLSGYEGMKQREEKVSAANKARLREALQRLVQLYESTDRPDQAAEWKRKLEEFERANAAKPAASPAAKPSP